MMNLKHFWNQVLVLVKCNLEQHVPWGVGWTPQHDPQKAD